MIYLYWSPPAFTEVSVTVTDGQVLFFLIILL